MKNSNLLLPIFASVTLLTACGEEPAPAPEPTPAVAAEPTPTLPAPDQELLTTLLADTCPDLKPVNTAVCRRTMGADTVSCEFGLGEDDYLRNDATLAANEAGDAWEITDPETVCAL